MVVGIIVVHVDALDVSIAVDLFFVIVIDGYHLH